MKPRPITPVPSFNGGRSILLRALLLALAALVVTALPPGRAKAASVDSGKLATELVQVIAADAVPASTRVETVAGTRDVNGFVIGSGRRD